MECFAVDFALDLTLAILGMGVLKWLHSLRRAPSPAVGAGARPDHAITHRVADLRASVVCSSVVFRFPASQPVSVR